MHHGEVLGSTPSMAVWKALAQDLAALHNASCIHTDIRMPNFLMFPQQGVRIIDLGHAHILPHGQDRARVTRKRADRRFEWCADLQAVQENHPFEWTSQTDLDMLCHLMQNNFSGSIRHKADLSKRLSNAYQSARSQVT